MRFVRWDEYHQPFFYFELTLFGEKCSLSADTKGLVLPGVSMQGWVRSITRQEYMIAHGKGRPVLLGKERDENKVGL